MTNSFKERNEQRKQQLIQIRDKSQNPQTNTSSSNNLSVETRQAISNIKTGNIPKNISGKTSTPNKSEPTIQTSAKSQHGYQPNDPDYEKIYTNISGKKQNIKTTSKQILSDIRTVVTSKPGTKFKIKDKEVGRATAFAYLVRKAPETVKEQKKLIKYEETVKKYEQGGFLVDITGSGVKFKEPSAKEVSDWKFGEGMSTSRAVAGSVMELGIPALFSGVATLITGDSSYWEGEVNRQYEKTLNLSQKQGESVLDYTGRFWTSPEAFESVYLPLITVGVGQAYTAIKHGATGVSTVGRLASFGAKHGAKVVKTMDRALLGAGFVGSAMAGYNIGSSFAYEHAGYAPTGTGVTAIGRTVSAFTIGYAGFKTGEFTMSVKQGVYNSPVASSFKSDETYLISKRDIFAEGVKGHKLQVFASGESPFVQSTPYGTIKGYSQMSGVSTTAGKVSLSKGTGLVSRTWRNPFGTKYTNVSLSDLAGLSYKLGSPSSSGYQKYFDSAVWTNRATGIKTTVMGYSILGSTGNEPVIVKPIRSGKIVETIKKFNKNIKVKLTDIKENPRLKLFEKVSGFSEYESLSIGKYYKDFKAFGKGLDYSKIYFKPAVDGFGGGGSGSKVVIGGGGVLSGKQSSGIVSFSGKPVGVVKPSTSSMLSSPSFKNMGVSSSVIGAQSFGKMFLGSSIQNINIKTSPISVSKISPIQVSSLKYKLDTVQTPVFDFKTNTIQTPVYKFDTIQSSLYDYKFDTIQKPIYEYKLDTIQLPPVSFPPPPPPVIDVPTPIPGIRMGIGGIGGGLSQQGKRLGSGYHFRSWKVPTTKNLLPGYKKILKKIKKI